ncbi:MAG TPA: hypothetical protein VLC09_19745, partial [Polyangiaceae bacterium]|nr:hypothetical protein [Polyangiaceae bacterium]
ALAAGVALLLRALTPAAPHPSRDSATPAVQATASATCPAGLLPDAGFCVPAPTPGVSRPPSEDSGTDGTRTDGTSIAGSARDGSSTAPQGTSSAPQGTSL